MSEWTAADERAARDRGWTLINSSLRPPSAVTRPMRYADLGYCLWPTRDALEQDIFARAAAGDELCAKAVAVCTARRLTA